MTSVFTDEAVEQFGRNYENEVRPEHGGSSRGGCMKAVYIGIGTLFGNRYKFRGPFHKEFFRNAQAKEKAKGVPEGRFNTIDRVFRALETEGVVFEEEKYSPKQGKWNKSDGTEVASLEADLVNQIQFLPNGSHFFGMAIDGAIHSLIVRLDKSDAGVRVYWMDQFSDGYDGVRDHALVSSPDVTGSLDAEIRSFGSNPTSVWQFNPTAAEGVSIDLDVDGDGNPDAQFAAVEDREDPDHSSE